MLCTYDMSERDKNTMRPVCSWAGLVGLGGRRVRLLQPSEREVKERGCGVGRLGPRSASLGPRSTLQPPRTPRDAQGQGESVVSKSTL
eukprot:6219277-Prymnesium_polylepis.1